MADLIDRQSVIDVVHKSIFGFFEICDDNSEEPINEKDKLFLEVNKAICNSIKDLPSAQPDSSACWGCNCPKMEQKTFSEMVRLHDAPKCNDCTYAKCSKPSNVNCLSYIPRRGDEHEKAD